MQIIPADVFLYDILVQHVPGSVAVNRIEGYGEESEVHGSLTSIAEEARVSA